MTDAAEIGRLSALTWLLGGCAIVAVLLIFAIMWQEMRADRTKHPFDDDIPHWW